MATPAASIAPLPGWQQVTTPGPAGGLPYVPISGTVADGPNPSYVVPSAGEYTFNGNSGVPGEAQTASSLAAAEAEWQALYGNTAGSTAGSATRTTEPIAREPAPATPSTGVSSATDPVLAQLLNAIQNSGGGSAYGQSGLVSLPPSTVLPTDTSGSTSSSSSPSTTTILILGVIASLIAAAIWWFVIKHKSLGDLKHAI